MPDKEQENIYEGLPDDAGFFERDDGYALKMRKVKGVRKPMWVKSIDGNESKKKPSDSDMESFKEWKQCKIDGTHPEVPDENDIEEDESNQKEEGIFVPPFATNDDTKALEIWGTLEDASTEQTVPPPEEGGKTFCTMQATVKDKDGLLHTFDISKGGIANLLSAHDPGKWCATSRVFHEDNRSDRDKEITRMVDMKKVLLWRVLKKEHRKNADEVKMGLMLTVRTKQWVKTTASDIKPFVKKSLTDNKISFDSLKVQKSDGVYGGKIVVDFAEDGIFKPSLVVNAGRLGGQAFRVFGGAEILACSNQLTMEVRKEVLGLLDHEGIRIKAFSRKVHRGDMDAVMSGVLEVANAINKFNEFMDEAKDTRISKDMAIKVLLYYEKKKIISKKVREQAEGYLGNEEVEQVPGSFYGLAMILSYVGTHGELKKGVSNRMGTLAGEIILVAKNQRKFTDLVQETIDITPTVEVTV